MTAEDIEKLSSIDGRAPAEVLRISQKENVAEGSIEIPIMPEKESVSQLHELFYRVLHLGPSTKVQDIWNEIRRDSKLEHGQRKYDVDDILRNVNSSEIAWVSRNDDSRAGSSFSRNSLGPTLSRIRKWPFSNVE